MGRDDGWTGDETTWFLLLLLTSPPFFFYLPSILCFPSILLFYRAPLVIFFQTVFFSFSLLVFCLIR